MVIGEFSPVRVLDKVSLVKIEAALLDENGKLRVVDSKCMKQFTQSEISQFCVKYGFYQLPTYELLDFIRAELGDLISDTIEIAAGNGAMARALGIRATDSFMQERDDIREIYDAAQQNVVPYGEDVERISGNDAVRKYKPKAVLASWCTHKYNPKEHWRGGNSVGVNEKLIIERGIKYIHIGNMDSHKLKPALQKKHRIVKGDFLFSRALNSSANAIIIWN